MFCGEHTLKLDVPQGAYLHRLRCRSWGCDDCMPHRLNQLKRLGMSGHPNKFITLTWHTTQPHTPDEAAQCLVRAWRNVLQRARRRGLIDHCEFLAVFEATAAGYPHLHILARMPYLPHRWLSAAMHRYASSPVVDIRAVRSVRHASWYLAKYVSKGPTKWTGCKRYWRSQGWVRDHQMSIDTRPLIDATASRWTIAADQLADAFRCAGWNVEDTGAGGYFVSYCPGASRPLDWTAHLSAPRAPPEPCRIRQPYPTRDAS